MIEYRFAAEEHRADVIDFINFVFSQAHRPHDFRALIPKVYGDGRGYADIHAVVLEDGKMRGVVGQYPMRAELAGCPLSLGFIGSVSTHPYARGAGYMIKMMAMQARKAAETGIALMVLGGQRQRYEYYGYSPVGAQYNYAITRANVRHALKNVAADEVAFVDFAEASPADIDKAYALYRAQPVTGTRSREDFEIIMRTWNATPYAVYRAGELAGYCVAGGKDEMSELILRDAADAPAFFKAWFAAFAPARVEVAAPTYDRALNRQLAAFAEGYSLHSCLQVRIVDLKNVLTACLTLKKAVEGLSDGEVVLQMDEETPVRARVENGEISVTETADAPDIHLPRLEMQQLLFAGNRFAAPEVAAPVDWFPLPLYLYGADHF